MRGRILVIAALLCLTGSSALQAEEIGNLLLQFFSPTNPVVLKDNPGPFSHAAHFVSEPNAQAIMRELNSSIATQVSTFPLGSSSPGFTYTFDPALGVFSRSAETFGPVFGERPLTAGKGKFSFGISYLSATYDTFEGQDLRNGDIQLYLTHKDTNGDNSVLNPWFEGDVIRSDVYVNLKSETTVLVANYGLAERFDVGVAVPIQRVSLDARINANVERLATGPDPFVIHAFPDGSTSHDFTESGTKSGLGDVVLRGKYNFVTHPSYALAAGLDVRLPTGDDANLLGSGATQGKLYLVLGGAPKRFSPRASVGYTLSSGGSDVAGDLPDELDYTAGFDAAVHSRVTVTSDFLGRLLFDTHRLVEQPETFSFTQRLDPTVQSVVRQTPVAQSGNLNLMLLAANVKVNLVGHLLLNGGALFGLGNAGLQDKVTPTFGLDYSF